MGPALALLVASQALAELERQRIETHAEQLRHDLDRQMTTLALAAQNHEHLDSASR